jgi:hypothetical protein
MDTQTDRPAAAPTTESADQNRDATRILGRFVADLRYEHLPDSVTARAKLSVLDWAVSAPVSIRTPRARSEH